MKINEYIFKKPWPYWVGGISLGLLNVVLLSLVGTTYKISAGFLLWGVGILEKIGIDISNWNYFKQNDILDYQGNLFKNDYTIIIFGIILGSLLATLLASEFKIKKIKNKNQLIFGLFGGILMGYGTRISFGCNIGAFFSAIPSFSLHGWVFGLFMFVGAFIGSKILIKYIL